MTMLTRRFALVAALGLVAWAAGPARASVLVTASEVGGDVVFQGGGTLDLTGLNFLGLGTTLSILEPSIANLIIGQLPPSTVDNYGFLTGPDSFGAGGFALPSSGSGDTFGILGPFGLLRVPGGYTSGDPLTGSSTFAGQTFASLGLTPGTYVSTLQSADTFTIQIGPSAVPEPSSLILISSGLAVLVGLGYGWRRQKATSA